MSYNVNHKPKSVQLVVAATSTYAGANLTSFTGVAKALMIQNLTNNNVTCQLNGDSGTRFTVLGDTAYHFDKGGYDITSVDFDNSASGAISSHIEIVAGVVSA